MLRIFSFLPPIGCYVLAAGALFASYALQMELIARGQPADSRIYVVGGILAFLLGFAGFQKSMEQRENAKKPRVSSAEVMQKLTAPESGIADPELDVPPENLSGPAEDSPLGRIRARSGPIDA